MNAALHEQVMRDGLEVVRDHYAPPACPKCGRKLTERGVKGTVLLTGQCPFCGKTLGR